MNEKQFITYSTFLQEIEMAIDVSISNLDNFLLCDSKAGLEQNISVWKRIQKEITAASLPASSKMTLSTFCDDGFKKYCQPVDKFSEA